MNRELEIIDVEGDGDGMIPQRLLASIQSARTPPRVLYITPTGGNPSGATLTLERKQQIYQVEVIEANCYIR